MRIHWTKIVLVTLLVGISVSCQNKFSEVGPGPGDPNSSEELRVRVESKDGIDQQLADIERIADSAKNIVGLVQMCITGQCLPWRSGGYSAIDLLADLSHELQKGIPELESGKFIKRAVLNLPAIKGLAPECLRVEAKMQALPESPAKSDDQRAIVSLKTCSTGGKFVDTFVLHGDAVGGLNSFGIVADAIRNFFPDDDRGEIGKIKNHCTFERNFTGAFQRMTCTDLPLTVNNVKVAVVDTLTYDVDNATTLEAYFRLFEKGVPIIRFHLVETPKDLRSPKDLIPHVDPIPLEGDVTPQPAPDTDEPASPPPVTENE